MSTDYTIRRMEPTDSAMLVDLDRQTADLGRVGMAAVFHEDYYHIQQALRPGFAGLVAEAPGFDGLVGSLMYSGGEAQFGGRRVPYVYLGGLGVHPQFRRQGIAYALSIRALEIAEEELGSDVVIYAGIQSGNAASLNTAKKWVSHVIEGRTSASMQSTITKMPRQPAGISVRPAESGDLEEIADRQNAFYASADLYSPKTAEELRSWLDARANGQALNACYVAVDAQGNLLAGMGVTREGLLMTSKIVKISPLLKVAATVTGLLPRSGEVSLLNGHWFWYAPGREQAGRALWDAVRWWERDHGTSLMLMYDSEGPVPAAVPQMRFARGGGNIVMKAGHGLDPDRFLYFNRLPV